MPTYISVLKLPFTVSVAPTRCSADVNRATTVVVIGRGSARKSQVETPVLQTTRLSPAARKPPTRVYLSNGSVQARLPETFAERRFNAYAPSAVAEIYVSRTPVYKTVPAVGAVVASVGDNPETPAV